MGLKRLSGRAIPTLIIAANISDIDAVATLLGTESLAIRRGITHGPIAMLVLPLLLTGAMLLWNRWRPSEQPVRAGPLLLLAYIGTLSHPALDFLNSYGIRLLEPFSSRWSYGDTLFIIDIWVWAALIAGFWISRRREKRGRRDWRRPAVAAFAAIAAYIAANGLISTKAEAEAERQLNAGGIRPAMVVANPQPFTFWSGACCGAMSACTASESSTWLVALSWQGNRLPTVSIIRHLARRAAGRTSRRSCSGRGCRSSSSMKAAQFWATSVSEAAGRAGSSCCSSTVLCGTPLQVPAVQQEVTDLENKS